MTHLTVNISKHGQKRVKGEKRREGEEEVASPHRLRAPGPPEEGINHSAISGPG